MASTEMRREGAGCGRHAPRSGLARGAQKEDNTPRDEPVQRVTDEREVDGAAVEADLIYLVEHGLAHRSLQLGTMVTPQSQSTATRRCDSRLAGTMKAWEVRTKPSVASRMAAMRSQFGYTTTTRRSRGW